MKKGLSDSRDSHKTIVNVIFLSGNQGSALNLRETA